MQIITAFYARIFIKLTYWLEKNKDNFVLKK